MGSFFNVLIYRLPRKQSIVFPASHCGECKKPIPFYLNIPIISYLILGGKCKYCGAKIHWHHFLVECLTPILFLAVCFRYISWPFPDNVLVISKYLVFVSFLIPIFFIDLFEGMIFHKTTIPLIVLGIGFSLFSQSDVGFLNALIGAGFVFALMVSIAWMYSKVKKIDGMGGGDIWLMTAMATFFGIISIPFVIIIASVLGLIYYAIFIRSKEIGFAFGPFLVAASIIWLLVGESLLTIIM